jgi:hypothetical protein
MTLRTWIDQKGPMNVAHLLKVDSSTVQTWKAGTSLPRPKHMIKIHQLSRGRVSYKAMIETVAKNKK